MPHQDWKQITFKPHPYLESHFIAKIKGFSIIEGPFVEGFEIKDKNGEIKAGLTLSQVYSIIEKEEAC